MDEAETFAALASGVRLDIIKSVSERPKTVLELTKELHIHRLTVRHHLDLLLRERLVEQVSPKRDGKAGRPAVMYAAARHARVTGFPPRHFEIVAEVALKTMIDAFGEDVALDQLRTRGRMMGQGMIDAVAAAANVRTWTPAAFQDLVLRGAFKDFGIASDVLACTDTEVHYRSFGCPFLELAQKMPTPVCDGLDLGFHDGLDAALGAVHTTRRACMGHGDDYCEYVLKWQEQQKDKEGG